MSIKKISALIESIDINDSSCTKCNVALIQNLHKSGFDVKVYHYTRKNIRLDNIPCYGIKEKKINLNYIFSRFQRVLYRNLKINFNPLIEKIFGFSFAFFNDVNSLKKTLKLIKNDKPDLIITLSKGASFRPHTAMLSYPELYPIWMANIHDPYPFHYNPRPYNWVEPGYKKKELNFKKISESARFSSFPSKLLKEWMGSYFPNFLTTGIIIPHQNSDYKINDVALPDYFDETKFNLLHAGNLMPQRPPKGLIEGYKLFLANNDDAKNHSKLIMLGSATYHTEMLKEYQKNIPQIYIYNGTVAFELVYKLQKNVSVNIILESKSEISPFLPGKFPHCVEANKPIISLAPYYSEVKRLLGEKYAYWSEIDDTEKIANIIENLYQIWKFNRGKLALNREDLIQYISDDYLKNEINKL
ncbi:UDP-glycosyltransferase [Flavobacterium sp.]|uniref:UDP-glycosyltransferase n=1 Tax=Flavobacterium sp. TaxID=239 RepID=UPI0025F9CB21|nr:UDP-glycosyltransferase [Flavobacterium sp.]